MKMKTIYLAPFLIVALFLIGCTYNIYPNVALPPEPLIEKLPIAIGIYYSDEFKSYEWLPPVPSSNYSQYKIKLGPPSVTLFDQIFSEMFEKVIQISTLPPLLQSESESKAIIEPEIDLLYIKADRKRSWIQVSLAYKITLYELNGTAIANWYYKGSGYSVSALETINHSAMVGEATQIAMRNVAAQFMVGFRKNSEAMKWLRGIGITASYF